jgi:hypothetical protein
LPKEITGMRSFEERRFASGHARRAPIPNANDPSGKGIHICQSDLANDQYGRNLVIGYLSRVAGPDHRLVQLEPFESTRFI